MKISIYTPTHESSFIPQIYECLVRQTYQNWEWVVLYNNGAIPYVIADSRVKSYVICEAEEKIGALKAYACERCTGDILLELDHDDLLLPTALEEVSAAFDSSPDVGFVYSNILQSDGNFERSPRYSELYGWRYREVEYNGRVLDEHISFQPDPANISKIWFGPNHLRAFRKSAYQKVGGYNRQMRVMDDLDLVCRLYLVTEFRHIDKPLYLYRVHGQNAYIVYQQEIAGNALRMYDQYIEPLALRWADIRGLIKIELGAHRSCRSTCYKTVDLHDADITCDLDNAWPFPDSSVGVVRASDTIEHLADPVHTMKEIYRVLAPGGYALLQTPSTDGRGAFQDPTHRSFWNENSFYYYTKEYFAKNIGTPVRFQTLRVYTSQKTEDQICWVIAHLVSLKGGYRPAGIIEI